MRIFYLKSPQRPLLLLTLFFGVIHPMVVSADSPFPSPQEAALLQRLLTVVPAEVNAILSAKHIAKKSDPLLPFPVGYLSNSWRVTKFSPQKGMTLRQFISVQYPALQNWIDDLTIAMLNTPTLRKHLAYTFNDPETMSRLYSVSPQRAEAFFEKNRETLANTDDSLGLSLSIFSFNLMHPRFYAFGITEASTMNWTGMTSSDLVTSLVIPKNQLSALWVLEHIIHETAILFDPDGYDNSRFLALERRKPRSEGKLDFTDLRDENGLAYPAIAIAFQALRALRFEGWVLDDLFSQAQLDLSAKLTYHPPRSERGCWNQLETIALTLGNFEDQSPGEPEKNQIREKIGQIKDKVNCLAESKPNFAKLPRFQRFPGPRPRLGGDG